MEAYNGGSIGRLTTSNAAFDAKLDNRYAELIASVKEREGRASSDYGVDGEKMGIHKDGGSQSAYKPSRRQTTVASDVGGVDDEAVSHSVSSDSERTVETPHKIRNNRIGASSPPPGSRNKTTGNRVLTRKSTSSKGPDSQSAVATASVATTSSAKISSLGTWICDACTFENLRNITRNSRCEMCDSVRPKEPVPNSRKFNDAEVVNIDC